MASEYINPNGVCDGDLDPQREIDPQPPLLENYVAEKIDFEYFEELNRVFAKYNNSASSSLEEEEEEDADADAKREDEAALSKKKRRKMSVADLKKISSKPDLDKLDATTTDPKLLVYLKLKSYRNTVPVPRHWHWSQKKKFLQGKQSIEKQPYQLPDYIAATGIEKIRKEYIDKGRSALKNIDYQVFYDAFFENQTKPKLTTYGDLYYLGKEFEEIKPKKMEPAGRLSRDMPEGAPPPCLANIQRHGSPHLDPGASLDHQPGGWDERWGELVD